MKGIVMERERNMVIVMTNNGQFLKLNRPNNKLKIGDEIIIGNNKNQFVKRFISVAAALLMIITGSYGVYGYYNPYGYINVDINPSVQMAYNLYDRVIDIKGLNEDGNKVIEKIGDYKNKPINNIINEIVDKAIEEEFIKPQEENLVLVTIVENNKKIDDTKLYKSVNNHIKETKTNTELMVLETDKKAYETAEKSTIPPGKSVLINKALKANKNLNFNDLSHNSIKEIAKVIKESKAKEKKDGEKEKGKEEKKEKDKESKEEKKDKGKPTEKKNNLKDENKKDKKGIEKSNNKEENSQWKDKKAKGKANGRQENERSKRRR